MAAEPIVTIRVEYRLTREDLVGLLAYDAFRHGAKRPSPSPRRVLDLARHLLRTHGDAGLEGWEDGAEEAAVEEAYRWAEDAVLAAFH